MGNQEISWHAADLGHQPQTGVSHHLYEVWLAVYLNLANLHTHIHIGCPYHQ